MNRPKKIGRIAVRMPFWHKERASVSETLNQLRAGLCHKEIDNDGIMTLDLNKAVRVTRGAR